MGIEFKSNLNGVLKALDSAAKDRFTEACRVYQKGIRAELSGQRSGRVYKTTRAKGGEYSASAPGEAPAKLQGILRKSIRFRVVGGGLKDLKGVIGSRSFKAPMLEYGTGERGRGSLAEGESTPEGYTHGGGRNRGKRKVSGKGMAARPFMKKAFLKGREEVARILRERWDQK